MSGAQADMLERGGVSREGAEMVHRELGTVKPFSDFGLWPIGTLPNAV